MEIKEAVQRAMAFAEESLGPQRTSTLQLEEIESGVVASRPVWLITLSSELPARQSALGPLAVAMGAPATREYKVFAVARDNGEVVSMKIRLLAAPAA